jgi:hypothetical protein
MLKEQVINNTWSCDACAAESNELINPYFQVVIQNNGSIISSSGEIDLCENCIANITIQPIVDYITKVHSILQG